MGDVVAITDASGGIGRATARRFAQDGARIALLARGDAGLEGASTKIEELGAKLSSSPPTSPTPTGGGCCASR
jgi:NAD(P)-dependent dehydrogenase (short-subunit alcohol dehydrogenase family)